MLAGTHTCMLLAKASFVTGATVNYDYMQEMYRCARQACNVRDNGWHLQNVS
jgi:hypothetical protein